MPDQKKRSVRIPKFLAIHTDQGIEYIQMSAISSVFVPNLGKAPLTVTVASGQIFRVFDDDGRLLDMAKHSILPVRQAP